MITLYSVFCCLASGSLCRWLALAESSLISSSWVFHILTTPVLYLQCTKYCNWSKYYRLNSEEFAKVSLRKYFIQLSHSNAILTITEKVIYTFTSHHNVIEEKNSPVICIHFLKGRWIIILLMTETKLNGTSLRLNKILIETRLKKDRIRKMWLRNYLLWQVSTKSTATIIYSKEKYIFRNFLRSGRSQISHTFIKGSFALYLIARYFTGMTWIYLVMPLCSIRSRCYWIWIG